jgi:Reverse transcriptase (RNA-dependent DNA polymerase)
VEWKHMAGISALCHALEIMESDYRFARARIERVYVEKLKVDAKSGKARQLCYPPKRSLLYDVQGRIKDHILNRLPLLDEVRGYRAESHNINTAAAVCGHKFMGKVDISKFHPSITCKHVATALREHGVSPSWSREIARMVTYKGTLPQGAPTSNHAANVVMDSLLRRGVKAFADCRGVEFRNFGDDIAFFGTDAAAVRQCVKQAKKVFAELGFKSNDKCRDCEHRGERREFIGCATGRDVPDYPRPKYVAFRKELRSLIQSERLRCAPEPLTTRSQLNSLRHRIAYVKRLNAKKARNLLTLFYRLCASRRCKPAEQIIAAEPATASSA